MSSKVGPPATAARRGNLLGAAAIIAATFLCYLPAFRAGWVWDDGVYVHRLDALRRPAGLTQIWTDPAATPQYYPIVFTTFWLEYRLWGADPAGYHAVNVALHAAVALGLWALLRRLGVRGAWLVAAIFAVHPVNVESVAWVSERKNVLSGLLGVAAAIAYFRFAPAEGGPASRGRWGWYAASLALFAAAVLSKTVLCMLPIVLLVARWWKAGRLGWRDVAAVAPMLVLGASLGLLTLHLEGAKYAPAAGAAADPTLAARSLIAGRALWFYAGKLVAPWPLMAVYPRWDINPADVRLWAFPLAAVAAVAALVLLRRRIGRGPAAGAMAFVVVLLPALGFFPVAYHRVYSYVADHFVYLAAAPLLAVVVAGVERFITTPLARARGSQPQQQPPLASGFAKTLRRDESARGSRQRPRSLPVAAPIAGAVLLAFGVLAYRHAAVFHDNLTLWQDCVAKDPRSTVAHDHLGVRYAVLGRAEEALREFDQVVALDPDFAEGWFNRGNVLLRLRRFEPAAADFSRAISLRGDYAEAYCGRGSALSELGRLAAAHADFTRAIELDASLAEAYYNRAICYAKAGGAAPARADLESFRRLGGQVPQEVLNALGRP